MNVLFLTHRLPYAPNRGDRKRAFHIIRTLCARGASLDVVSLVHDAEEAAQVGRVRSLGARVTAVHVPRLRNLASGAMALAGTQPLTHVLLDAPEWNRAIEQVVGSRQPVVVLAFCSSMARFALQPPLRSYPLVVDLVDVDSEKWAALAKVSNPAKRWIYRREVRYLSRFERRLAESAFATVVVNEREASALRRVAPGANVGVVPVGVDLDALTPRTPAVEKPRLIFCGVMDYAPNVDGVLWFARDVWPQIRARRSDAEFAIVGSSPTAAIRRLAAADSGISVTGKVEAVHDHLWGAAVSVVPLLTARGVQTKVLEAVAAGLPVVVTSNVHGGLPKEIYPACLVADTSTDFAERVLALLEVSGAERRAMAAHADIGNLGWAARLSPLWSILTDAADEGRRRQSQPVNFAPTVTP
jgi:sugar transferase (PEP-CTERM/EpsH1 system associated)